MKKNILIITLIVLLTGTTTGQNTTINPPTKKLTQTDLKNKNISELWLMRNSIFAKHGRPFKTYELHAFFTKQKWYKINKKYKKSNLSETDKYNADLIKKIENEKLKNNYLNNKTINFNNIQNIFQYPKFTAEEQKLLTKNGFVVLPTNNQQLFHIYENNDYLGIPSFISTDLILQLYHMYFDMTLRTIEEEYLYEILKNLLEKLITEHKNILKNTKNKNITKATNFNITYLDVALSLLTKQNPSSTIAKQEYNNCLKHSGLEKSPLFNKQIDYSQYIPRGHYTRNNKLKNFFLSMMWLGNTAFEIEKNTQKTLSAVILTHTLHQKTYKNKKLIELWQNIYEPTTFYVGLSDDTGPIEIQKEIDKIFPEISKINDYDNQKKLTTLSKNLPKEKISGHGIIGKQKKQFRFMGQRFVPDSYIFNELSSTKRPMPNGLDIFAGFGNKLAKELMLSKFKTSWNSSMPDYPQKLEKIIEQNKQLSKKQWTQNLYYYWIYSLKALYNIKNNSDLPFFMTTKGWKTKTLNTAMASWAELRHNTVLFAKQSVVAECGGGDVEEINKWLPQPPKGYIEPNIELYSRITQLMQYTNTQLDKRNMLNYKIKNIGLEFIDLTNFLQKISEKELNNQKISPEEYEQIQKIGSLIDNLTLQIVTENQAWDNVKGPDKNLPNIVDVHTANNTALQVGVGKPQEIYVIIEIDGKLRLTRGAIFSYYEFNQPASNRLTDEQWQKMLNTNQNPKQPSWINYKSKSKKSKNITPLYKPQLEIPDYSKTSGWNLIYYDTGC